jgi:hypothetical protein
MSSKKKLLSQNLNVLSIYNKTLLQLEKKSLSKRKSISEEATNVIIINSIKHQLIGNEMHDVYSFTVKDDEKNYSDEKIGAELMELVPRTAIITHNPVTDEIYSTFALRKLARSNKNLKDEEIRIKKMKISEKVNGKPCSLQKVVINDTTFIVFIQKMILVYIPLLDLYDYDKAVVYLKDHDQLRELLDAIYPKIDIYIKLLDIYDCVISGELNDFRHIVRPSGPKKFIIHTAMSGLNPINLESIEKFCNTHNLDCVTTDAIIIPESNTKLYYIWSILIKYIKDNLNTDIEGWVVCLLDEDENLIMLLKMKKLPYKIQRSYRELLLKSAGEITAEDLHRCWCDFQKIFKNNISKTKYYGLTEKGQTKWLNWLLVFNIYAIQFISDTGEKLHKKHVSINTYYGKMNGYGWLLNELILKKKYANVSLRF